MVAAMRIFVAGATGATGQVFIPMATAAGHELKLHVRVKTASRSPLARDPRARILDLDDAPALRSALAGCDAVVSFVGTMRSRFKAGDTYESSDIASTRQLAEAAVATKVPRFLLLSSFGAGSIGAYLKMKEQCERIVKESGLAWTIFRPSALVSPDESAAGTHGARKAPAGSGVVFGALRKLPGLRGVADDVRPIPIAVLCDAFLRVLAEPRDGQVLEGRDLWALASPRTS